MEQEEVKAELVGILDHYCNNKQVAYDLVSSALLVRKGAVEYRNRINRPPNVSDGNWWFMENALEFLMENTKIVKEKDSEKSH